MTLLGQCLAYFDRYTVSTWIDVLRNSVRAATLRKYLVLGADFRRYQSQQSLGVLHEYLSRKAV